MVLRTGRKYLFFHAKKPEPATFPHSVLASDFLDNNTDQSSLGLVDDASHRVLELLLAFFTDNGKAGTDTVPHKLFHGFSEDVRVPDAFLTFGIFPNIGDEIFRLGLASHDGSDLRLDICPDKMNRGTHGPDFHAVFASLMDHRWARRE